MVQNAAPAYPQKSDALTSHMRNSRNWTYKAYSESQIRMERYWCLQYLIQEGVQEIHATVWRENLVRLDNLPYMTKVYGMPELPGSRVSLLAGCRYADDGFAGQNSSVCLKKSPCSLLCWMMLKGK